MWIGRDGGKNVSNSKNSTTTTTPNVVVHNATTNPTLTSHSRNLPVQTTLERPCMGIIERGLVITENTIDE